MRDREALKQEFHSDVFKSVQLLVDISMMLILLIFLSSVSYFRCGNMTECRASAGSRERHIPRPGPPGPRPRA